MFAHMKNHLLCPDGALNIQPRKRLVDGLPEKAGTSLQYVTSLLLIVFGSFPSV